MYTGSQQAQCIIKICHAGPVAAAWASEAEGAAMKPPLMSQMLDGVQRMTQLARDTTSTFIAASSFFGPAFGESHLTVRGVRMPFVEISRPNEGHGDIADR